MTLSRARPRYTSRAGQGCCKSDVDYRDTHQQSRGALAATHWRWDPLVCVADGNTVGHGAEQHERILSCGRTTCTNAGNTPQATQTYKVWEWICPQHIAHGPRCRRFHEAVDTRNVGEGGDVWRETTVDTEELGVEHRGQRQAVERSHALVVQPARVPAIDRTVGENRWYECGTS